MRYLLLSIIPIIALTHGSYAQISGSIRLMNDSLDANDRFGNSIKISGDYIFIGAKNKDYVTKDTILNKSGAVYIYQKDNKGWKYLQILFAPQPKDAANFGSEIAVDGTSLMIISRYGKAYVYKPFQNKWKYSQLLEISNVKSISLYQDYGIVGVPTDSYDSLGMNYMSTSGSAYIIHKNDSGKWSVSQKIQALDRNESDHFGGSVSIFQSTIVVGAQFEDEDENNENTMDGSGSAYVYVKNKNDYWYQKQKLVSPDRDYIDYFGTSVSNTSEDIIVSAFAEEADSNGLDSIPYRGSVYVFQRDSMNKWINTQKIVPAGLLDDFIGMEVKLFKDYLAFNTRKRLIYMYKKNNFNYWYNFYNIHGPDSIYSDDFGSVMDMDSNFICTGAPTYDRSDQLEKSGCAYVYSFNQILSLNEKKNVPGYALFPNPSNGNFEIVFNKEIDNLIVTIYNLNGQVFYRKFFNNTKNIPIKVDLESGIYLLRLESDNGIAVKKLIIYKF